MGRIYSESSNRWNLMKFHLTPCIGVMKPPDTQNNWQTDRVYWKTTKLMAIVEDMDRALGRSVTNDSGEKDSCEVAAEPNLVCAHENL